MSISSPQKDLATQVDAQDHVLGDPDARVTLLEYGDYQCPYCGEAQVVIREILKRMSSELRFVFRHYPLTPVHQNAQRAAEAAEAAAHQGKFWEMHNLLFRHQSELSTTDLVHHARQLQLDLVPFETDLTQHVHAARIRRDVESGNDSGVSGTPTFFIQGRLYSGSHQPEPLLAALRAAS